MSRAEEVIDVLTRENAALKKLLDRAHERMDELKAQQPSAGVVDAHHLLEWNRAQPDPRPIVIGREYQVAEVCAALSSSLVSAGVVLPGTENLLSMIDCLRDEASHEDAIFGWNECLEVIARINPCRAQAVVGEWVLVSERMPEVGQYLLVAGPRGYDSGAGFYRMTGIMRADGIYDGNGCWLSDATHWQVLAAAPSAQQKESGQ